MCAIDFFHSADTVHGSLSSGCVFLNTSTGEACVAFPEEGFLTQKCVPSTSSTAPTVLCLYSLGMLLLSSCMFSWTHLHVRHVAHGSLFSTLDYDGSPSGAPAPQPLSVETLVFLWRQGQSRAITNNMLILWCQTCFLSPHAQSCMCVPKPPCSPHCRCMQT